MFAELVMLFIIAVIWAFTGYQIIRFIIPRMEMLTIIPLGAITGETLYLFFVNILSYAFQVSKASWIVLGIMIIVGVFLFNHNKKNNQEILAGLSKPLFSFLLIIAGLIFFIYSLTLFFGGEINFDSYYHQPFSATIAEGNFPPKFLMNPDFPSQYHYGVDLLAASLITVGDLKPWTAINVIVLWNLVLAFFAAFAAGRTLNNNFLSGLFSGILLFFGGSWLYLSKIFSLSATISGEDLKGQVISSYGIGLFHNPTALAVPIFLGILCIIHHLIKQQSKNGSSSKIKYISTVILIAFSVATLALIEEEYFLIISAAVVCISLSFIIKSKFKKTNYSPIFALFISAIMIGGLITVFQGGTLTQTIINNGKGLIVDDAIKIQLRTNPGITFWGDNSSFMPINDPKIFFFLLMQFGPMPFIFPIIYYLLRKNYADKNNTVIIQIMLLSAILSFIIPIFVKYPISDINFTRILAIFKHIGNIFLGSAIGIIAIKKIPYRKYLIPIGFVVLLSYLAAPILYNFFAINRQFSERYRWGFSALPSYIKSQDILIADEAKKIIPQNSRILTNNYVGVATLWGRFVPYSIGRNDPESSNPVYLNLFPKPSIRDLKKLKIKYVYISPFQEKVAHIDNQDIGFLLKNIDQKYLQDNQQWFSLIKKWEYDNQSYYLYSVMN